MVKFYHNVLIREYVSSDYPLVKQFQEIALQEGSESLTPIKYDPSTIDGQTWLAFIKERLIGISACEVSHYTGDPSVAARICRYHILKEYRHSNVGFRILPYQVEWAKKKSFKIIYWTHDVSNEVVHLLYQSKRTMPGKSKYFHSELYKSFKLQYNMLFKVDTQSNFLQYIYAKRLAGPDYVWKPKTNVIFYSHSGTITSLDKQKILEQAKHIAYC